jgi:hypothetical protein
MTSPATGGLLLDAGAIKGQHVPQPRAHTDPVTEPEERAAVFTVLFVCTGNICRSALAQQLGRAYMDEALGGTRDSSSW